MKTNVFFKSMVSLSLLAMVFCVSSCTKDNDEMALSTTSKVGQQVQVFTESSMLRCSDGSWDGSWNGESKGHWAGPASFSSHSDRWISRYRTPLSPLPSPSFVYCGESKSGGLWAGQTISVGYVNVANDKNYLYVFFAVRGSWVLSETHLYVGSESNIPTTKSGNPKIGKFPYSAVHDPTLKWYRYIFPLRDIEGLGTPGSTIMVLAHAVVLNLDEFNVVTQEETAWAGCDPLPDAERWSLYFEYTIQECI